MGWFLGCFKCVQTDESKKQSTQLVKNKSRSKYLRSLSRSMNKSGNSSEDTVSVSIKPQETGNLPVTGRVNDQAKHINVNLLEATNLVREVKYLQNYDNHTESVGASRKDSESSQILDEHEAHCFYGRTNDATSGAADKTVDTKISAENRQCRMSKNEDCEIEALDANSLSLDLQCASHSAGVADLAGFKSSECGNTSCETDGKTTSCQSNEATALSNSGSCLDSIQLQEECCSMNYSAQRHSIGDEKLELPQLQSSKTNFKTGVIPLASSKVEPESSNGVTSEDKSLIGLSLSSLSNDSSCLSSTHSIITRLKDGSCISLNSVMTIAIPNLLHSSLVSPISNEDYAYSQQNSSMKSSAPSNIEDPFLSPNSVISKQQMSPSMTPSDCSSGITTPSSVTKKLSPAQLADERPILGTVAAHWNHSSSTSTRKWWDGKGIPNSTNKYKEDQKVNWHTTPFEVRLERALARQGSTLSCRQKHPLKKQLFVESDNLHDNEIVGCHTSGK